jgi:membrane-bound lytic murein transglycosylase D
MMESGIPLDYNNHVKGFINLYGVRKKELTERILTLSKFYFPMFEEVLDKEGLPQEFKYLAVVESALNPQAQSWAGACGLWQFIHSTGLAYGLKINGMEDERRDPMKATLAACQYFKNSYALYGDWLLVIASYNCGPGNVNKAIRRSGGKRDFWKIMNYLPRETRGYVPAFIAVAYVMNNAEKLGLTPAPFTMHSMVENVQVKQYLNPEYRKKIIPATTQNPHTLTLPYQYAMRFAEIEDSVYALPFEDYSNEKNVEYISQRKNHRVKRGETLLRIARLYGVKTSDLKAWNIIKGNSVRPGKNLVIYVKVKKKGGAPIIENEQEEEININEAAIAKKQTSEKDIVADTIVADSIPLLAQKQEPVKTGTTQLKTAKYHKVVAGDTLYSISKKYPGLTIDKLRNYNQLSRKAVIKPGTKLKISAGS